MSLGWGLWAIRSDWVYSFCFAPTGPSGAYLAATLALLLVAHGVALALLLALTAPPLLLGGGALWQCVWPLLSPPCSAPFGSRRAAALRDSAATRGVSSYCSGWRCRDSWSVSAPWMASRLRLGSRCWPQSPGSSVSGAAAAGLFRGTAHLHLPSYYCVEKGGTPGYSFARYSMSVVRYRAGVRPRMWGGAEWAPENFSAARESAQYDYFIVKSSRDLTAWLFPEPAPAAQLERHVGDWVEPPLPT
jgi:hypothetical protein